MRASFSGTQWLLSKRNNFVGLSFGGDATTEHECGSKELSTLFGYSLKGVGADRKVSHLPQTFGILEFDLDGEQVLLLSSHLDRARGYVGTELRFPHRSSTSRIPDTACAWDSGSFAVMSRGKDRRYLKALHAAFLEQDIGPGGLLKKQYDISGISFVVFSKIPKEAMDELAAEFTDETRQKAILDGSGIHQILRAAGKQWFSLDQTSWVDKTTKTDILVWLNPMEQRDNNFGWYTLDQLRQWARNEGPIPVRSRVPA